MKCTRPLLLGIALSMAGCATDIPQPLGNQPSEQVKLRATHHWDLVAGDVAEQLAKQLPRSDRPVFVVPPTRPSHFEAAMYDFIITQLVNRNIRVATSPAGAVRATLSTRIILNQSGRQTMTVPLVAIAAGIMVAYNVALHANRDFEALAVLGGAAAFDEVTGRLKRPGGPSQAELIVTMSVEDGVQYLARKTDVYYIDDADFSLFALPPLSPQYPGIRTLSVRGD